MRISDWSSDVVSSDLGGRVSMKSCLVFDDSKVVRMVARRILEKLDFEIVEAADGAMEIEACGRKLPDAVLLDWNMPVMNGIDFLRELRRMPGGDGPVEVFCNTRSEEHTSELQYIMRN